MINGTTLGDFCAAHGFGKRPVAGANNPAFARQCQELQFDLFGQVSLKTPLLVSLASDVYALKSLAAHREGNIVMSSWLKLGHISAQELANLRFAGRLEDLEACMSHVRGSMLQLDVLPDLGLEAAAQELDNGQISQALQNKHHVWWVHDAEERCIPLPAHQDWEKTKQERAPKALTVCQQAKYDQWLAHPQRDLLLDLSRCCRTNKGGKNVALISLRLSMLPEELQMRCDDTWKPLFVRQYMSAEEHPVVQDLPLGIQQPAPAHLLQPGLDSAPEPDGEDMEASEQGECEAEEGAAVPKASHGSGDYKHLLPKREGAPWSSSAHVMCVLCVCLHSVYNSINVQASGFNAWPCLELPPSSWYGIRRIQESFMKLGLSKPVSRRRINADFFIRTVSANTSEDSRSSSGGKALEECLEWAWARHKVWLDSAA